MQFLEQINVSGIFVGLISFLIIGLFHPLVIKGEYYWGQKCRWIFLVIGIISGLASIFIGNQMVSILLGVLAFSSFWSIKEIKEQEQRVKKGWFPRNPKRRYPWDN